MGRLDPHSKDNTRLIVTGIPPGMEWQELKDHFKPIGRVAHANVKGGSGKGGKGGKGGGETELLQTLAGMGSGGGKGLGGGMKNLQLLLGLLGGGGQKGFGKKGQQRWY